MTTFLHEAGFTRKRSRRRHRLLWTGVPRVAAIPRPRDLRYAGNVTVTVFRNVDRVLQAMRRLTELGKQGIMHRR